MFEGVNKNEQGGGDEQKNPEVKQPPKQEPKAEPAPAPTPPPPQPEKSGGEDPEDMFAEVDTGSPQMQSGEQMTEPRDVPKPQKTGFRMGGKTGKIILIVALSVVAVGLVGALGYYLFTSLQEAPQQQPTNQNGNMTADEDANMNANVNQNANANQNTNTNQAPQGGLSADQVDSDGDGLSNAEEQELGTNPNSLDSDGDGLFDNEEIEIYFTDPLNPDSDGDGFLDGEEVANGYDPNGPGRLFDVNQQQ